jgi:ribosomal protein S18 acetylase RimI-like enzyme
METECCGGSCKCDYSIRPSEERDYDGIVALLDCIGMSRRHLTEERFADGLGKNPSLSHVAVVHKDEHVIGNILTSATWGVAHLGKLAVCLDHRRRGIGSSLVKKVDAALDELGIELRFAHVERTNTASLALLRNLGYDVRTTHLLVDKGAP